MNAGAGSSKRPWAHRGRNGDPLYGIQNLLRAGAEKLTDKQWTRLEKAIAANEDEHLQVYIAWSCAQQLRSAYRHPNTAEGRKIAEKVLASFPSCPVPEIARLGRTLKRWRAAFLAYFDTARSNNGGTEAMNGLIELHRRVARGFRNRENYRLRMLLMDSYPDPDLQPAAATAVRTHPGRGEEGHSSSRRSASIRSASSSTS